MLRIQELRELVLEEAKTQLKKNRSLLDMLKGSTPLEDLARLREEWVEPLEEIVEEHEGRGTLEKKHPPLAAKM